MVSKARLPTLPDNQRWSVSSSFNTFLIVKLQERRWWGWATIDRATEVLSGGDRALAECVDHIMRRDYFHRIRAEADQKRRESIARIPFGVTKR